MTNEIARKPNSQPNRAFKYLDVVWWWKLHLDEAVPFQSCARVCPTTDSNRDDTVDRNNESPSSIADSPLTEMWFLVNGKRRLAIVWDVPNEKETQVILCGTTQSTWFPVDLGDVLKSGESSFACPELVTYPNSLAGTAAIIKKTKTRAILSRNREVLLIKELHARATFSQNAVVSKAEHEAKQG